ncbi:MAG: polysaccharide deacetylase family protein [Candidatus Bathyarchaeia archaeon]
MYNKGQKKQYSKILRERDAGRYAAIYLLVLTIYFASFPPLFASSNFKPSLRVALFFDDGWKNQYDEAFPILKEFGFKATFAVVTDYIGLDRGTLQARMNRTELKELQNSGMEIASHTKTHPYMLNLTHERLIDEIANSKKALTQLGFNVKTFVYPYGEWNQTIIDYVKEAGYTCARTIKTEPYTLENQDANAQYRMGSWPITNQTLEEFQKILSNAKENAIIVLTYHNIANDGPQETSTPTKNFREQMKYLKENNFQVVLLTELFTNNEKPSWDLHQLTLIAIGVISAACGIFIFRKGKLKDAAHFKYVSPRCVTPPCNAQFGMRAFGKTLIFALCSPASSTTPYRNETCHKP